MVIWCADWPAAAVGATPDELLAVVHSNRVVAVTPAARAGGVRRGQRRREAQGRCPALVVAKRDEAAEARRFEPVVQVIEEFTPRIELTRPGSCAFATRGPSRYFGGDESLARQIISRVDSVLDPLGWSGHVRVGAADGPFAASLAARSSQGTATIIDSGSTRAFLGPLPVEALERPELAGVLRRLGICTFGQLAALPGADMVARFGLEGQAAHRLAAGLDEHPPATELRVPDLAVSTEIDPPAERVDEASFIAKALADELLSRLDALALSCTRVLVSAETEHGERSERLWRHEGSLTAAAVSDRVRWQLDGWLNGSAARRPTSGIVLLRLAPDEVMAAHGRQLGFWGSETGAADRAARAVARVQGLLGPDAVRVIEWRGGRDPSEQVRLVHAHAVDLTASRPSARRDWINRPWPGQVPAPSPAIVHESPPLVGVLDGAGEPVRVSGRGLISAPPATVLIDSDALTVMSWAGPWPVDERWWDPDLHRRRARLQVVLSSPGDSADPASQSAHLLAVEGGKWRLEATYD